MFKRFFVNVKTAALAVELISSRNSLYAQRNSLCVQIRLNSRCERESLTYDRIYDTSLATFYASDA